MKGAPNPVSLTIAGSDSAGASGIQADLKTFAALGVHGATVVTAITAQNSQRVLSIQPTTPGLVRRQLDAVLAESPVAAAKTGMLFSAGIIGVVADFFRRHPGIPLVVDPVMLSTSGGRLLQKSGVKVLTERLLPRATLVTPNRMEAEALLKMEIRNGQDLQLAAHEIHHRFGCAALVKGGHGQGGGNAVDFFFDGKIDLVLTARRIAGPPTRGTGCVYSAAIAALLSRRMPLRDAVQMGKKFVTRAIVMSYPLGDHRILRPGSES